MYLLVTIVYKQVVIYVFTDQKDTKGKTKITCTKEEVTYRPC